MKRTMVVLGWRARLFSKYPAEPAVFLAPPPKTAYLLAVFGA
jgi:hypothetical protein